MTVCHVTALSVGAPTGCGERDESPLTLRRFSFTKEMFLTPSYTQRQKKYRHRIIQHRKINKHRARDAVRAALEPTRRSDRPANILS